MSASIKNWYPMYVRDYAGDTRHLNVSQHGAYRLLLDHQWMHGSVPGCPEQLALICCCSLQMWLEELAPVVMKFYHPCPEGWFQKRMEEVRERALSVVAERAAAGAEGAKRRWGSRPAKPRKARKSVDSKPMAHLSEHAENAPSAQSELQLEEACNAPDDAEKPADGCAFQDIAEPSWQTHAPSPSPKDSDTSYLPTERKTGSLWKEGLARLKALVGRSDRRCRELIGRWRKALREDDGTLLAIIDDAGRQAVAEPVSWIEAQIACRKKPRASPIPPKAKAAWWRKRAKMTPPADVLEAFRDAIGEPLARAWLSDAAVKPGDGGGQLIVGSRFKADYIRENFGLQLGHAARSCGLERAPAITPLDRQRARELEAA